MDEFIVNLTVEVQQVGNGLAIQTPVPMQFAYETGRWRAFCETPPVETPKLESFEKAIIAGARQAAAELQAAVIERPRVLARITPDDIPEGMFE
jgi:hypothetical protein